MAVKNPPRRRRSTEDIQRRERLAEAEQKAREEENRVREMFAARARERDKHRPKNGEDVDKLPPKGPMPRADEFGWFSTIIERGDKRYALGGMPMFLEPKEEGAAVMWVDGTTGKRRLVAGPVAKQTSLFEKNPRKTGRLGSPMRRGPFDSIALLEVTELGRLLELQVESTRDDPDGEEFVMRWAGIPLAWSQEYRCLVALERVRSTAKRPATKADPLWKRWSGRDATWERGFELPSNSQWYSIGVVKRIDYWSDKWTAGTEYTHEVTTRPILYRFGSGRGPTLWVVGRGNLTLTKRGLIG